VLLGSTDKVATETVSASTRRVVLRRMVIAPVNQVSLYSATLDLYLRAERIGLHILLGWQGLHCDKECEVGTYGSGTYSLELNWCLQYGDLE